MRIANKVDPISAVVPTNWWVQMQVSGRTFDSLIFVTPNRTEKRDAQRKPQKRSTDFCLKLHPSSKWMCAESIFPTTDANATRFSLKENRVWWIRFTVKIIPFRFIWFGCAASTAVVHTKRKSVYVTTSYENWENAREKTERNHRQHQIMRQ